MRRESVDETEAFVGLIQPYFSARTAVVASGPDFSANTISTAESYLFTNGALEHKKNLPPKKSVWLVTDPILKAAFDTPADMKSRKRAVAGAEIDLVISSNNMSSSEVADRLSRLDVSAGTIAPMTRIILAKLLLVLRPRTWVRDVLRDSEVIKSLLTPFGIREVLKFSGFFLGESSLTIPTPLKPSGGVQAALITALIPRINQIFLSGISLATSESIIDGVPIRESFKRGHMPIDETILRHLVTFSEKKWFTSDLQTAHRTGMSYRR